MSEPATVVVTMDKPKHRPVWDLSAGFRLTWQAPRPLIPLRLGIEDYGTAFVGLTSSPHPSSPASLQHWIGLAWPHTLSPEPPPLPDGRGLWLDKAPISCFTDKPDAPGKFKTTLSSRAVNKLLAHWVQHHHGRSWFPMVFKPRTLLAHYLRSPSYTQIWLAL